MQLKKKTFLATLVNSFGCSISGSERSEERDDFTMMFTSYLLFFFFVDTFSPRKSVPIFPVTNVARTVLDDTFFVKTKTKTFSPEKLL